MRTNEIPSDQWKDALDGFSRRHEGWIVTVEVVSATIGDQSEAEGLALVGIAADVKDGAARVHISAGHRPDAHVTRIIEAPARVWLTEADLPAHDAVAVEARDGTTTILRFRHIDADRQLPPAGA